jgi:hypothetical protein
MKYMKNSQKLIKEESYKGDRNGKKLESTATAIVIRKQFSDYSSISLSIMFFIASTISNTCGSSISV